VALALGLCFVLALSEVSTFDLGGIRTIGTELATLYPLTGSEAAVAYAAWPLVVVAVAVAFGLTRQFRAGPSGGGDGSPIERRSTNRERRMTIALLVLSLLVPVGLLVTALNDRYAVSQILQLHADDLAGSLSIAVATACLACVIAGGALAVRGWGRLGQGLSIMMQGTIWTAMLVPGSLVAVSILRLLAVCHVPDGIRNSWLVVSFGQAGRLTGVALILLLLADTGRVRVLSEMAAVDGASRTAAWWHVHLPLSWRMIAGAGLLVMMMSMTELATTMVLLPPGVPNFAQRLLNQMHYARDPQTLASCLALVATFAIVTTVVFGLVRTVRSFHTALAVVVLLGTGGFAGCGHRPEGEDRPDVVTYFGCTGKGQGQFMYPRAIEMAPDRTLFVIDKAGRVQHFTAQGGFLSEFQMHEIELGKPTGLAIGPDGDLYIADTHYSRVMVYSQGGQLKRQFGHFGQEDGCFIYPTDVAFGRDGRVFVSEYGGHDRVSVFDGQGRFQYSFGSPGHEKGQFSRPEALCVDPERDLLYVADACNHRIAVYTCEGRPVTTIGSLGIDKGQLRYPYGLTRLTNGNLVVCEYGNNRLQVFTPQGRSVAVYGGAGRQPGELAYPWAVAVDPSDRAYVVDSGNNRIQIWQL
jgi:sugar lactone lactonase YvrE/ABC-type spermidine/putrescine transport system permease subunit II